MVFLGGGDEPRKPSRLRTHGAAKAEPSGRARDRPWPTPLPLFPEIRTTGAPCGVAGELPCANAAEASPTAPPVLSRGCDSMASDANPSDPPPLPLTAQTRV